LCTVTFATSSKTAPTLGPFLLRLIRLLGDSPDYPTLSPAVALQSLFHQQRASAELANAGVQPRCLLHPIEASGPRAACDVAPRNSSTRKRSSRVGVTAGSRGGFGLLVSNGMRSIGDGIISPKWYST